MRIHHLQKQLSLFCQAKNQKKNKIYRPQEDLAIIGHIFGYRSDMRVKKNLGLFFKILKVYGLIAMAPHKQPNTRKKKKSLQD